MKKSGLLGAVCACLAVVTLPAHAVIVGDKDWLQVTETIGYSWNQIDAIFDASTGQCDVAGCLLGGAVDLTDYVWANNAEVDSLLQLYNGGSGLSSLNTNNEATSGTNGLNSFFSDFTPTVFDGDLNQIVGWTRETSAQASDQADVIFVYNYTNGLTLDKHRLDINELRAIAHVQIGGWFYQPVVVPIPSALWLFGSGLLGLVGMARRKKAA